jgi:hypothetical protein
MIRFKYILLIVATVLLASCEKLETVNTDPNNPVEVPSNVVFSGAEKFIMDYVYDVWFSGRQCMVYSQYWAQRNYTEEDRYQIRESVNNSYFNYFYRALATLDRVIELNTSPAVALENSVYGANCNQIAASRILKAWLYLVLTDTWGAIPYSEAGKLLEGVYYPKYDSQQTVYAGLLSELKAASAQIDESEPAFTGGDRIYGGDASKWKKFANSLICRIAVHTSKVDPQWRQHIAEALAGGVFESNDDAAAYHYSVIAPEYCHFYEGTYIQGRNDFTITRPFADILKGQRDTLNSKTHPWEGVTDPRLYMFTSPGPRGSYIGQPYGLPTYLSSGYRGNAPNWYGAQPMHLQPDYPTPLMTYAELLYILSEYNGFSEEEYREGIAASIDYWSEVSGMPVDPAEAEAYVEAVVEKGGVNAETVAIQKYIDLYTNGTEAWTEIRRTGYPAQLTRPGDIIVGAAENDVVLGEDATGEDVLFKPLSETKGLIIARVKYPTNESTVNGENFNAAVSQLQDGTNNYYSQMFWDVRTLSNLHPANK